MKKSEVPQDESNLESANFKELCYAVDENGEYTTANSSGWNPKTIALNNAIEDINERIAIAKTKVLNNETSPLEYYMELHKMDIAIIASYVKLFKWQVKRHFKLKKFNTLSDKILKRYADVFEISVNQLKHIDYGD